MTTSPPTQDALEPCPFCGGTAHAIKRLFYINEYKFQVQCGECSNGTSDRFEEEKFAITAWNRRALATPINGEDREVIDRLQFACRDDVFNARYGVNEDITVKRSDLRACLRALASREQNPGLSSAREPSLTPQASEAGT